MKYLRFYLFFDNLNEELDTKTYIKAANDLLDKGYDDRSDKMYKYAIDQYFDKVFS